MVLVLLLRDCPLLFPQLTIIKAALSQKGKVRVLIMPGGRWNAMFMTKE
ncbi:MAG: hypothetical protein IPO05_01290 [Flavobacteriales bacterium]|jgi:hypothetical protein|nr:hypothetical protein [Flavobacteriales bacterium]MBK9512273.1 hypothetical protein [Flavobacteriales bacterium]